MGYEVSLENIYPKVSLPVSKGTPMISPLIKLKRSINWKHVDYTEAEKAIKGFRKISLSTTAKDWMFLTGHVIDGILIRSN